MKKLSIFLWCIVIVLIMTACELPEPDPTIPTTAPTSSVPISSEASVPTSAPGSTPTTTPTTPTTSPASAPTAPTSVPGTTPPADPTTPTTPTSPTTPATGPAPTPEPEPDYREDFMAVHNAGQKYTFTVDANTYEISLNPNTGVCTVLHRQALNMQEYFDLGPITCPSDTLLNYHRNYYYMGTYQPGKDGAFEYTFDRFYLDVDLSELNAGTISKAREYVWDNIQNQWKDYYLTQAECEMWDKILDGQAAEYICRWKDTMALSGSASLPLQLTYWHSNGEKYRSYTLASDTLTVTDHNYTGSYYDRVYDLNGKTLYTYEWNSDGTYHRTEYDDLEHLIYSIDTDSDGGYSEYFRTFAGDTETIERYHYEREYYGNKLEGYLAGELYLDSYSVDVYRKHPDDPSQYVHFTTHKYDRNNRLVHYALYTEKGLPLEEHYWDEMGREKATLYTYENGLLMNVTETDYEGYVITYERIYEGQTLVTIQCTWKNPEGDIVDQWEETPPAAPTPAPTD